jgi:PAS domain S-box-containing protein
MPADLTKPALLTPADLGIGRLFDRVRDAVIVADAEAGRITLWNPAAENVFGYTANEAVGMSIEALVPASLKVRHRAGLANFSVTGHGVIIDGSGFVEVPALTKSGQQITVELSLSPIDDPGVGGRYALAIIRDITERTVLRTAAEHRLREVEALYEADEVLHRSLRLESVLRGLVDVATEILGADKTSVLVWDERRERLVPGATRGFRPESVARMSHAPGEGITGRVAIANRAIAVEDASADPRVVHQITDPEGIRSLLYVPIEVSGEVFGVFGVHYCAPHEFTDDDERLLESLAQRAALAIENARLYERAQQVATLEERQRLARDLHDAVAQTLFAAGLMAEALPSIWRMDVDSAERALAELQRLTWGALAEMRTLLLELRPAALASSPLIDLLRQLGQAASGRTELKVEVHAVGQRLLPTEVHVGLYRIAQEALNNVVKHAGATRARIWLRFTRHGVRLSVTDNGRGIDPSAVPPGRMGLGIMHERAAAIGASLTVERQRHGGSQVQLIWRDPLFGGKARRE